MNPFVLLGAGSSKEADIPTAVEMTRAMMDRSEQHQNYRSLKVLRFVIGGLKMGQGVQNEDIFQEINIEELFAAIEMLAGKEGLAVAPFVAQWHPAIEEIGQFRLAPWDFELEELWRELKGFIVDHEDDVLTEQRLSEILVSQILRISKPASKALFEETMKWMIQSLVKMVWLDDESKVDYLLPLVEQARTTVLSVATLNYDNTIELAGKAAGILVSTGIEEWSQTGLFGKPKSGVELLKLHGSIDWKLEEKRTSHSHLPHDVITQLPRDKVEQGRHKPALIFGTGNKLTAQGPYMELLRTFRQRLEEHSELLVIGYSFSDEHINEVIYGWLNRNQERKITVVEKPGAIWWQDNYFTENYSRMLGERCTFVPEGAGAGIRSYFEVGVQKSGDV